jgi:hypothetical protein
MFRLHPLTVPDLAVDARPSGQSPP